MTMSTIYLLLSSMVRPASRPNKYCAIAGSTHVLAQERQRSVAGERCGRGVVRSALIAVESVVGGIDVDLRRRMRGGKFPHAVDRDIPVAFSEVSEHRAARR